MERRSVEKGRRKPTVELCLQEAQDLVHVLNFASSVVKPLVPTIAAPTRPRRSMLGITYKPVVSAAAGRAQIASLRRRPAPAPWRWTPGRRCAHCGSSCSRCAAPAAPAAAQEKKLVDQIQLSQVAQLQATIIAAIGGAQEGAFNTFAVSLTKPQAQTLTKVLQLASEVVV